MNMKIYFTIIFIFAAAGSSFSQLQTGKTELTLLGNISYLSGDQDIFYYYNQIVVELSVGVGKCISPHIQIGFQPVWNYWRAKYQGYNYLDYNDITINEESIHDSELGFTFFTNYNISTTSKTVPYLTAQYKIADIVPEGEISITETSFLVLGGGLRYFVVERAALHSTLLYHYPLKDTKLKYKILSIFFGISIIL